MRKISEKNTQSGTQNGTQKFSIIPFTDLTIASLKTRNKRDEFWCEGLPGFGIRVSKKRTKSWIYQFRFEGKKRKLTLGRYPKMSLRQARSAYINAQSKIDHGIDPSAEQVEKNKYEREIETVCELVDLYISFIRERGKKSWKDDYYSLKKYLLPKYGECKSHQITHRNIASIVNYIVIERKAPQSARHFLSYTKALFRFARNSGIIEDNPCRDIEFTVKKSRRSRTLSPEEIYLFWHGMDKITIAPIIKLALKFVLCTMTRKGETRHAEWSHINFNHNVWTIPGTMTKNGKTHYLPLNNVALDILSRASKFTRASDIVFGSTRLSKAPEKPLTNLKVLNDTALSHALRLNRETFLTGADFTVHDLRRTGATIITTLGCPRFWASLLLNHTDESITDVYDKYTYDWEKQKGMEVLGYAIERIVSANSIHEVPDFRTLRKEVESRGILRYGSFNPEHKSKDFPTTSEHPVSYNLSYGLNWLENVA